MRRGSGKDRAALVPPGRTISHRAVRSQPRSRYGPGEGAIPREKQKRPEPCGPGRGRRGIESLDLGDVRGAGPLRAVHHLETNAITLVQGPETLRANLRMVNENVRTTLAREETEALGLVEPLDRAFDHERAGLLSLCLAPRHLPAHDEKPGHLGRAAFRTAEQRQLVQSKA